MQAMLDAGRRPVVMIHDTIPLDHPSSPERVRPNALPTG